ncbi:hypothetical protein KRP22_007840 [Phytophthora ramorum]|nr:hypothetical protein KRP22_4148 [Phytophthora ramorum]
MALRASAELPACWTPTDQRIMEHLLLDQSDTEDHQDADRQDARSSPRTVELQAAEKQEKKQPVKRSGNALKGWGSRKGSEAENRELQEKVEHSVARAPHVDHVGLLMQNQLELVREFYEPITSDVWTGVQQHAQQEYEQSRRDDSFLSSGASIMGWSDFRKVEEASVKFVLSKGFPNARALHLMNFTWQKLSTPSTYASFFNPAIPVKMQILQVISHDALVLHRVLFNPQTQSSSNSLELLWRVRLGEEYVIFDSALQHNAVQQCLGASYKWTQMTTSLGFAPLDADRDSGCMLRHGGWIRTAVTNVDYWFMEMFFMALRFESTMVAPVFALPAEQEAQSIGF